MLRSLLWSLALAAPLLAQQPVTTAPVTTASVTATPLTDSTVVDTVAPGLVHTYYVRQQGPWRVHEVRVDLRSGQYDVRSARALDSLRGRETVSGMMARAQRDGRNVRVAINADFFNLTTGESVNNQVSDGRIWRALAWSGVPSGPMRSARGQFGVTRDGRPVIDRFVFTGTVHAGRVSWALDGVNVVPSNGQGLVLWLPEANGRRRADSAGTGRELRVTVVRGSWRDSLMLRVRGRVTAADSSPLAADEGALVAYGSTAARLDSIARLQRAFDVHPSWLPTVGMIDELVGGWPVILRDRVTMVEDAATREFTAAGNANVRHPRSFVGFDADTSHLYLVAVDGRSAASVGMTLVEAADFLRDVGVAHALNLDGGGSTALVVDGRVINTPSDRGGERTVANALLIEERRRPK